MARDAHPTPLDSADVILSDLDGVVYRGAAPIPHAVTALNAARETKTVGFLTNNASRLAADVAEQLTTMGLDVDADDVVTSPQATLLLLSRVVEPGAFSAGRRWSGADDGAPRGGVPTCPHRG